MSGERFPDIDWFCDRCNANLNFQPGFDDHKYLWQCTECGFKNSISSTNIFSSEDAFRNGEIILIDDQEDFDE